jgi:HD-like signal output (HDOD) protein
VLKKIRRTFELRPVPPVLHYVISQTNRASTSIQEVANAVRQDQALALRVMKVANSSFYTTGKRAQNLLEAAGRLGMSGIRNAVVTVVTIA